VEHYPDHLSTADYRARARARATAAPAGVGAAVERTANDFRGRPGRTWECVVTGGDGFHFLEVWAPDLGPFEGVAPTRVEEHVEAAAARLGGLPPLLAQGLLEVSRRDLGLG
jgi:hypothetical protein